jgi:hypothetical protein
MTDLAHSEAPEPPPTPVSIDAALAKQLARGGWKAPAIVFSDTNLRVVSARKGRARHLLFATSAGALVDGGVEPHAGDLTVERATPVNAPGITELALNYRVVRGADGFESRSSIWLVRESGGIACKLEGSSVSDLGTACGSSGWTTITLRGRLSDRGTTIEVATEHSGLYSEADGKGGCQTRSPVRSRPKPTRYLVPTNGTCKRVLVPNDAKPPLSID